MPARTEPSAAPRSRFGAICATPLARAALVLAAGSLAVGCFLNPKTDDLPKPTFGEPGGLDIPGGGDNGNDDGDNGSSPSLPPEDMPPILGEGTTNEPPPDAGPEPMETLEGDAGSELADTLIGDAGVDAD